MLMPGLVLLGSHAIGWVGRRRPGGRVKLRRAACKQPAIALPAEVDITHLLEAVRQQFIKLQAAWDAADLSTLGALTTPQMLAELCAHFPPEGSPPNRTDVLAVQAKLLGFDDLDSAWVATIEFTGMIREAPDREPTPFRELWLLTRDRQQPPGPACGGPWRLARQQALL
ncbi:Tim44 domain-containing protein [Piscinibacter sakaiensis]|uniref:Tim44 domain-containing protein n=1 Tax=Piscinibacter sakaiensis TaxID=1547922 RepID=UPI003AACC014